MAETFPIAFGRYHLTERLAVGGMAEIFLARAPGAEGFERMVVIKRLLPHLATDAHYNSMFIDEAKLTARLSHPKIAQTYELGRHEGQLFIAMEFVDGIDVLGLLRECAHQRKRLRPELVIHIISEVLDALDFAHSQVDNAGNPLGIVHRDISPSNVLLSRRGVVKLVDFGIARATEQDHKTGGGTLKGKYGYMSPEQVVGEPLDARADIFAVGIVMAEMLMGRRLFAAPNELDVLLMVRDANLTRLDRFGEHIDADLGAAVRRALRKNIDERYQSAGEFRDALDQWLFAHQLRVTHNDIAALVLSLYDNAWQRKRQAMEDAAEIVAEADPHLGNGLVEEARASVGEIDGIPSGALNVGDSLPITIEPIPPVPAAPTAPPPSVSPSPSEPPATAASAPSPAPPTTTANDDLELDLDLSLDLEPSDRKPDPEPLGIGAATASTADQPPPPLELDLLPNRPDSALGTPRPELDLGDLDLELDAPLGTPTSATAPELELETPRSGPAETDAPAPRAPSDFDFDIETGDSSDLVTDLAAAGSPEPDDSFDIDIDDDVDEPPPAVATPPVAAVPPARPRPTPDPPTLSSELEIDDLPQPGDIGREIDLELARLATGQPPRKPVPPSAKAPPAKPAPPSAKAPPPRPAPPRSGQPAASRQAADANRRFPPIREIRRAKSKPDADAPVAAIFDDKSVRYPSIADAVVSVALQEPDPAARDFDDTEVSTPRPKPTRPGKLRLPTAEELAVEPPPSPPSLDEIPDPPDDHGDLVETSPIRTLYRLITAHATGLLAVTVGGIRKEIFLNAGTPVFVSSNISRELFGEYLVAQGAISEGELAMALAMMPHYGGKLGDTLVGLGLITPLEVFRQLSRQVRDKLIDFCTWSKGKYAWYEGREHPREAFPLDINAYAVVGAGILALPDHFIVSWANQRRDRQPRPAPLHKVNLDEFEIGSELREIYDRVDGKRTIANLASGYSHMVDRLRFLRFLFLLVEIDLAII